MASAPRCCFSSAASSAKAKKTVFLLSGWCKNHKITERVFVVGATAEQHGQKNQHYAREPPNKKQTLGRLVGFNQVFVWCSQSFFLIWNQKNKESKNARLFGRSLVVVKILDSLLLQRSLGFLGFPLKIWFFWLENQKHVGNHFFS